MPWDQYEARKEIFQVFGKSLRPKESILGLDATGCEFKPRTPLCSLDILKMEAQCALSIP